MAWARVDDGWWAHPKVLGVSLEARGLWTTALSWSCAQRTNRIPVSFLRMVAGDLAEDLADELVRAGLWDFDLEADAPNHAWIIHDWAEYQELSLSEKRAEAGRKGGLKSGAARSKREAKPKQTEANARSKREANGEAGTRPNPTHPIPSQPVEGVEPGVGVAVVASDASLARTRPRNLVWDTLADVFGEPSTKTARSVRGKVVASLTQAGATPAEIHRRVVMWPLHYPDATLTDLALEKHWDALARPPLKATTADVDRLREKADHERRLREAEQKHAELRGLPS